MQLKFIENISCMVLREREKTALNAFHLVGVSRSTIGAQNLGR
jgi:hypothetical protein